MATWLYQLNQRNWPPGRFRVELWEGERWSWQLGSAVLRMLRKRDIYFRTSAPSDHLKMPPWWDNTALTLADKIRGKMKQRTLWLVPDNLVNELREGMTSWIGR